MDGGRENRFLAGSAEISHMGGGHSAAHVHTKQKPRRKTASARTKRLLMALFSCKYHISRPYNCTNTIFPILRN